MGPVAAAVLPSQIVANRVSFDRKAYFPPDMPESWDIARMHDTKGTGGRVDFVCDDQAGGARPEDCYIEEDSAYEVGR